MYFQEALTVIENYNGSSDFIELTYPTTTILGQKFRVDNSFYGVKVCQYNFFIDYSLLIHMVDTFIQPSVQLVAFLLH